MAVLPCYRCQAQFECKPRNPSHFCEICRIKINREKARERQRQKLDRVQKMIASLPDSRSIVLRGQEDALVSALQDRITTVQDRQPEGWKSPSGSEDGRSTYFKELAGELDTLSAEAANDPWWEANPHWAFGLAGS